MRWLARAFRWALGPRARRFRRALEAPGDAQAAVRACVWANVRRTEYGARYPRFEDLPVVDADALRPWLERQRAEEGRVLVADRVRFYERTSGSTGPAKYIPYTRGLLRSFTGMFGVWAHDLLENGPPFSTGRMYFSVSPDLFPERATQKGVPVGTEDDRDYLSGWLGLALRPFWVSPPGVATERDPEAFRRRVCTHLVQERRLEVISVWSPSFLKVLLDWMETHRDELPNRTLIGDWAALWPDLKLISCWASGSSAWQADQLGRRFPGVLIQGKGLLATEAPVTVPLIGVGEVPVLDEVLVELEEPGGRLVPLEQAEVGGEYGVVLSQVAGLSRYRLGDTVRVTGRHAQTPVLTLEGRGEVSDLVGEKLSEGFVRGALETLRLDDAFYVALIARRDHYVLLIDRSDWDRATLAGMVDGALSASYRYRQARALGQLGAPRVVIAPDIVSGQHRGVVPGRWGGVKHRVLRTDSTGVAAWLES